MSKLSDAKEILNALQVPTKQQNGMCCCVLLAMAGLTEELPWSEATNNWIRIHDVIAFANSNYGMTYAENSRETFRKQAMHHFRNAAFIEDNGKATNSPNYRYRLTDEMLRLIRSFGQNMWNERLSTFLEHHDTLVEIYASKRTMRKMPVKVNGADFTFSPGKHNQLQKAIIEEFAPRFAPNSECLYVGDTVEKDLVKNEAKLRQLGFAITLHDKMPDVVNECMEKINKKFKTDYKPFNYYGDENAEKVIAERFPNFNFSTLDWGELDPFYLEHPEEIPIEHEFIGYRQDGDVAEDYQGNLYLVLCDPGIHPIGSVCMEQSELDDAVKLGKREDYTGELLEEIPE